MNYREFNPKLDYGKLDIFRHADADILEMRLSWKHGQNWFTIRSQITEIYLLQSRNNVIVEVFQELIEKRNEKVEQIKYWTNCDILY